MGMLSDASLSITCINFDDETQIPLLMNPFSTPHMNGTYTHEVCTRSVFIFC